MPPTPFDMSQPVYVDMTKAGTSKAFGVVQSISITQIQIVGPLRLAQMNVGDRSCWLNGYMHWAMRLVNDSR